MEPLPRHWAHVDADIPLPEAASTRRHRAPGTTRVRLWGGSPVSEADALARARERQERLEAQGLPAGRRTAADGAGWYYPSGQVREEIVEEVEGGSGLIGVVTRNRYGALVLNTDAVLIADVDRQDDGDRPARRRLFGRKKQTQQHADPAEQNLLEAARALAAEHPDWGVHVHRTRAGFRVLISGADAAPGSPLVRTGPVRPRHRSSVRHLVPCPGHLPCPTQPQAVAAAGRERAGAHGTAHGHPGSGLATRGRGCARRTRGMGA
jgi:hypothetical protein